MKRLMFAGLLAIICVPAAVIAFGDPLGTFVNELNLKRDEVCPALFLEADRHQCRVAFTDTALLAEAIASQELVIDLAQARNDDASEAILKRDRLVDKLRQATVDLDSKYDGAPSMPI